MHVRRLTLALAVLAASIHPAVCPTPMLAQAAAAPAAAPLCTGSTNIIRVSEIKPGMMPRFLQAVAAQQAWYKAAGTPDQIQVMRIMERDPATRTLMFSETEAVTTHIEPASRKAAPHDAGYDAFVAMYKESSTIKSEYQTCMPAM